MREGKYFLNYRLRRRRDRGVTPGPGFFKHGSHRRFIDEYRQPRCTYS